MRNRHTQPSPYRRIYTISTLDPRKLKTGTLAWDKSADIWKYRDNSGAIISVASGTATDIGNYVFSDNNMQIQFDGAGSAHDIVAPNAGKNGIVFSYGSTRSEFDGSTAKIEHTDAGAGGFQATTSEAKLYQGSEGAYISINNDHIKLIGGPSSNITLECGFGGDIILVNVPTSDPAITGALWSNSGVLTISAGG